jgi:hypothetical protein
VRVIGGDDIIRALEAQLKANVPLVIEALGLGHLGEVKTWQMVPSPEAIAAAQLPAVALVSPSMNSKPYRSRGQQTGTWQVSAGIFARGGDHEQTQTQIQAWVKVLRTAALLTPLTDTGISLTWVGEAYDVLATKQEARTIAGGEVQFDAHVDVALDLTDLPNLPPLRSVHTDVQPH